VAAQVVLLPSANTAATPCPGARPSARAAWTPPGCRWGPCRLPARWP